MVEREARKLGGRPAMRSHEGVPPAVSDDGPCHRRQPGDHLGDLRALVERLSRVDVALGRQQDPRLDLAEPIEHALHAKIWRARRPYRANRRGAEHGDDGLGDIGEVGGDPVARLDPLRAKRRGKRGGLGAQLPPRHRPRRRLLGPRDDRRGVVADRGVAVPKDVLGEVQTRVWKEASPRHAVDTDGDRAAFGADDAAKGPHRVPELERPGDTPVIELRIGPALSKRGQVRQGDALCRGGPERRVHPSLHYRRRLTAATEARTGRPAARSGAGRSSPHARSSVIRPARRSPRRRNPDPGPRTAG